MASVLEFQARRLLDRAGIEIGGTRPWDIRVLRPAFYARILRQGSLGLGESYMDGWWECERLDQFFHHALGAGLDRAAARGPRALVLTLAATVANQQTPRRAGEVGRRHYDAGNDLFESMLDRRMIYTEGRWSDAATLDDAQEAKLDLVCRALRLEPGMRVLDVGCGWGGFARFAAERYGARVCGVTVSREQWALGAARCSGLPVELRLQDYRDIRERYHRVVSLGMFEHVGSRNYARYFAAMRAALVPDGALYLSTIGTHCTVRATDPWIERYIFPNSHLPSAQQIGSALDARFLLRSWSNWDADYDQTLMAWFKNFQIRRDHWARRYGERFCRMWSYYLLACAGAFRARQLQAWHLLLHPAV